MKRSVQILLLVACMVPLWGSAREETMEERKHRIMRKYLRERTAITQSESMVPEEQAEDEGIVASEMFKQAEVDLQRQEPGMAPLPQPPRRAPPRAENPNWLLAEESLLADPYADPFAPKDADTEPKRQADWTTWGSERESSPYAGTQRENRFDRRGYDPASEQPSSSHNSMRQETFNPQDPRAFPSDGVQSGFQQDPALGGRGLYGQQPGSRTPYSASGLDLSRDRAFNSSQNQGRLQSPFPRATQAADAGMFGSDAQQRKGSYTPYKSPYQTQREQRQQQRGGYSEPETEYRKQDPYQKWKEQNPTRFDPTRDDAFIDELMPKTRR